jgi:hypothetical protein
MIDFVPILLNFLLDSQTRNLAGEAAICAERRDLKAGGGGGTIELATMEDKLIFILFYFKFYPIQALLGYFFGLSQAQANEWIHRLTPVLHTALGYRKELPTRTPSRVVQFGCNSSWGHSTTTDFEGNGFARIDPNVAGSDDDFGVAG